MVQAQPKPIEAAEVAHGAAPAELPALRLPPEIELTDALLLELSELNEAWRLERTADGELSMTLPSFPLSSGIHVDLNYQMFGWSLVVREGRLFDAEIGIVLPDSALTMPDAAWFDAAQAAQIDEHDFIRIAPAFVLEVRSASQTLVKQQDKMERWMANGVRLGWLVDPIQQTVWVYRPGEQPERLARPLRVSGEPVLRGFVATFERIWR